MLLLARCFLLLSVLSTASYSQQNVVQSGNVEKPMQSKELNKVANETGLTFPAGSKLVQFSEPDVAVDPVWVAKLIIPTSSYDGFRQALLKKSTDNTIYDGALANSTSWWKPTAILLTHQYLANSQTFVKVVVSKEGNDFAVYIECAVF